MRMLYPSAYRKRQARAPGNLKASESGPNPALPPLCPRAAKK